MDDGKDATDVTESYLRWDHPDESFLQSRIKMWEALIDYSSNPDRAPAALTLKIKKPKF